LYVRGLTQHQIGIELQVTQQTVSLDLCALRKQWLQSSMRDFDAIKAEQLAKLDEVERVAWEAWSKTVRSMTTTHPDGTVVVTDHAGDPRFLDRIAHCIEVRLKVIGAIRSPSVKVEQNNVALSWDDVVANASKVIAERGENSIERQIQTALNYVAEPPPPSHDVTTEQLQAKITALEQALAQRNGHNGSANGAAAEG
jgi:hypothetical protein